MQKPQAADPWLWLAGLSVCRKREGVPLPRSGGGWEGADAPAAPYKHRLAHDPGGRRPSGRAFRCVGVLGRRPKRILPTFVRTKVGPRRVGVLIKPFIRLAPPLGDIPLLPNGSRGLGRGTAIGRGSPHRRRAKTVSRPSAGRQKAPRFRKTEGFC